MKGYTSDRRVVIMQKPEHENIEQVIFILRKEVEEQSEDFILEEARKIVNEFAMRNGIINHKIPWAAKWIILCAVLLAVFTGFYIFNFI